MNDRNTASIAVFFYVIAALLPLSLLFTTAASLLGWINLETSAWALLGAAAISFIVPFIIGTAALLRVKRPWPAVDLLPFLSTAAYALLPDPILTSLDDAAALSLGAVLSTWISVRKNPRTPRWIIMPLLGAAVYTLVGGVVPGWLDETLVDFAAVVISLYSMRTASPPDEIS